MGRIAESACAWMENLAADDSHGYDQVYRWGERGDYDCSSAVITSYEQAGVPVIDFGATYTGNMRTVFLDCGFRDVTHEVDLATGAGLRRGDVLLNHVHHTALYCGNGMEAEASINEMGRAKGGSPGDQTGREILVRPYRNYPWSCVLRYDADDGSITGGGYMFNCPTVQMGEKGNHVLLVQEILKSRGIVGANGQPLALDSDCGGNTVHAIRAYQEARGLTADGVAGSKTLQDMIAL